MIAAVDHKHRVVWGIGRTEADAARDASIQLNQKTTAKYSGKLHLIKVTMRLLDAEKYCGDDLYKMMKITEIEQGQLKLF